MCIHFESAVSGRLVTTDNSISQLKRSAGFYRGAYNAPAKPPSPQPIAPPSTPPPPPLSSSYTSSAMFIDMALAASYKPVLVCIVKVGLLMIFHYTSASLLFITERYALVVATLYIDQWVSCEFILNTNSCLAIIAGSLLIHELRDAGIPERIHGPVAHTILLSLLVSMNVLVLMFGEHHSLSTTSSVPLDAIDEETHKKMRQPVLSAHNQSQATVGAFVCVLCNTILLVLLCTCAIPTSAHDPFLNNLRVWSFMALSLTWMFTVNYENLRYSTVSKFTPCVLRFSCILFITPLPFAIGGVLLMASCLATIHALLHRQHKDSLLPSVFSSDHLHNQATLFDKAVVVNREPQTGSVISYRTPILLPESVASPTPAIAKSGTSCNSFTPPTLTSATTTRAAFGSNDSTPPESSSNKTDNNGSAEAIDYTALFEQVLSEHKV